MQPRNFLKAINGQAVDSYWGFFVHSLLLSGREGCPTCVFLTHNCSDVGARCVLAWDVQLVSPYNSHQYVGWHGGSQIAEWEQWFSLIQFLSLSLAVTLTCFSLCRIGLSNPPSCFSVCTQTCVCKMRWEFSAFWTFLSKKSCLSLGTQLVGVVSSLALAGTLTEHHESGRGEYVLPGLL